MDIEVPAIPLGVLTLLNLFAPYAIALINVSSARPATKRIVATFVSVALTALVLLLYYIISGDLIPSWPLLLLLGIGVSQTAFNAVKPALASIEARHGRTE